MSEATELTPHSAPTRKTRPRLDEATRRAIIARVVETESISGTAKEFGLHTNTVSRLWATVKKVRNAGLESLEDWRAKLDGKSYKAVERSLDDPVEPHKAATTGLTWLKGSGVLQGDNQVNVTIQQMIGSIPEEWRAEMITTPQVSTSMPTTGCGPIESVGYEGKTPDETEGKRDG
jgi:transposase-like protein